MSPRDKRDVTALHRQLMDRFPRAFPQDYDAIRPLKVGILADLIQRAPDLDPVLLRRTLANHTRRDGYLLALLHHRGDRRYDLDGQPVGTVTPEERAEAARLLAASTQRGQAKAEQVRTHKAREEQRRQQRELKRRNREAKAARKASTRASNRRSPPARPPWPRRASCRNRALSASAAWPARRRPGPKSSRAPRPRPSSSVVPRPRRPGPPPAKPRRCRSGPSAPRGCWIAPSPRRTGPCRRWSSGRNAESCRPLTRNELLGLKTGSRDTVSGGDAIFFVVIYRSGCNYAQKWLQINR